MNHLSDDRIRLQKYMSECGVASRRKSEELIAKGAVKVNGTVAKIGDSVDPKRDIITLNGKKIENKKQSKNSIPQSTKIDKNKLKDLEDDLENSESDEE